MDLLAKDKNKLIDVVNDLKKKKSEGGVNFFDKIDEFIRNPKNADLILNLINVIYQEQGKKFNLILSGNFGDWVYNLIKSGKTKINGTVIHITGSLRANLKNRTFQVIQGIEDDMYNKDFVLLDDSYYSGSTQEEIEKNLKKYGSKIIKTYVIYDGSFQKKSNVYSIYRYYDYHSEDVLPIKKLVSILNSFSESIPYDIIENKIMRGEIRSVKELLLTIKGFKSKFNVNNLNLKSYSYKREYEKKIYNYKKFLKENFSKSISPIQERIKPEVDEKTITIRSNLNDLFHIDIFFDDQDRVDYISNDWNVALPDWYGMKINMIDVKSFVKKYGLYTNNKPRFYCGYLLGMDAKKYNL